MIFAGRETDSSADRGCCNTGSPIGAIARNNENLDPRDLRSATCTFGWLKSQWLQLFGRRFFAPAFRVQDSDAAAPCCTERLLRQRTIMSGTGWSFRSYSLPFGGLLPRLEWATRNPVDQTRPREQCVDRWQSPDSGRSNRIGTTRTKTLTGYSERPIQ
jgi:hypothetical protein